MAWRIDEYVIRGEIDNREKGRVTGRIWFAGMEGPVDLDLAGNPYRDLAGHLLRFSNPTPKEGVPEGFAMEQCGAVGDITASRKVKIPECSMEELMEHYKNKTPFPWHWGNSLYLEWYSERNGRVVIESAAYTLEVVGEAAWVLSEKEERGQQLENEDQARGFMEDLCRLSDLSAKLEEEAEEDADRPAEEMEADAHEAMMDVLFERVEIRMRREGLKECSDQWDEIYEEEREKLRREMGLPEPEPLTPEQEEEQERWIEEMNEVCREALEEAENSPLPEPPDHPLVTRCTELGNKLREDLRESALLPEHAGPEHPLSELEWGVMHASVKLAGAMSHWQMEGEWPPDELAAGDTLVRLKKARGALRDALAGMDAADEQNLGVAAWREAVRAEVNVVLEEVLRLIREVRESLK